MIIREIQVLGTVEKKEVVDEEDAVGLFSNAVKNINVGRDVEVELNNVEVEDEDEDVYYMLASYAQQEQEGGEING